MKFFFFFFPNIFNMLMCMSNNWVTAKARPGLNISGPSPGLGHFPGLNHIPGPDHFTGLDHIPGLDPTLESDPALESDLLGPAFAVTLNN